MKAWFNLKGHYHPSVLRHLLVSFVAVVAWPLAAPAAVFTNNTTISPENTLYENQDIVVSNATLTVNGPHTFGNFLVGPGGVLTHSAASNGQVPFEISVTDEPLMLTGTNDVPLALTNVSVSSVVVRDLTGTITYTINVDYSATIMGVQCYVRRTDTSAIPDGATVLVSYNATTTTNSGLNLVLNGDLTVAAGGAIDVAWRGYSGTFGTGRGATAGTPSSGGGGGHGGYGGFSSSNAAGGLVYDSYVLPMDKGSGGGANGGPGGGAVRMIIAGTATIDGLVTADGAGGGANRSGGGAGGSIYINTSQAIAGSGTISADGGPGEPIHGGGGGGGRIALVTFGDQFTGVVKARGGAGWWRGGAGTIYRADTILSLRTLLVDNGGFAGTNTLLQVTNGANLTISGNASATATGNQTLGSFLLASGSALRASASLISLIINASNNVTIQSGAILSVDGLGSLPGSGTGAGFTSNTDFVQRPGSGAGHGGAGGNASTNVMGGNTTGSQPFPFSPGGGGGNATPISPGGPGGGVIRLIVGGTLLLDGTISANGGNGSGTAGGGGAGGSIWVTTSNLNGAGTISANGGNGAGLLGGGGGGGRIALEFNSYALSGPVVAYGGGTTNWGGAGTVFYQTNGLSGLRRLLVVDNAGRQGTNTVITGDSTVNLILRNAAVGTVTTFVTFANLLVTANSIITVRSNTTTTVFLTITGNATIHAGSAIIVDGYGLPQNTGPGMGRFNSNVGLCSGGGHGGYGGASAGFTVIGGNANDSSTSPSLAGSGGGGIFGGTFASFGGAGGGIVRLTVNLTLTVDGRISANGGNGGGYGGGGGSGGSIWLSCSNIVGSGVISANGGNGVSVLGGGGSGGRISISLNAYNQYTFGGTVTAYGGSGAKSGAAGTFHLLGSGNPFGVPQLIVDNGGPISSTNTTFDTTSGIDLLVKGGGSAIMPSIWTPRHIVVQTNGALVTGTLVSHQLNPSGNVTVDAGGAIHADGRGSTPAFGPGMGGSSSSGISGGGGYGGMGGGALGGTCYGSVQAPVSAGSGGGNGSGGVSLAPFGGFGGGALRLTLPGQSTLTVNGRISANGAPGDSNSGGGSGGSLQISAANLAGSGVIAANGGNAGPGNAGGGGGGRVSVTYNPGQFTGIIQALGGTGLVPGGAGTVFLKPTTSSSQSPGRVIVDNFGLPGAPTLFAANAALPTTPYDLTVQKGAVVQFTANPTTLLSNLFVGEGGAVAAATTLTNLELAILHDLTIASGGAVHADGKGYTRNAGPGAGMNAFGNGAGHGGVGGGSLMQPLGGPAYGSPTAPVLPGSGGGTGFGPIPGGGEGGGAIRLHVGGTLTVNGRLAANGNSGLQDSSGGGSGGSIWVSAGLLAGNGQLTADGGWGELFSGGGGAGGRIATYSLGNTFSGSISVAGGLGAQSGGTGTVYQSTLVPFTGLSHAPSTTAVNPVTTVDVTFNAPLNPFTLDASDVSLQVPLGAVAVTNFTLSTPNLTRLRVTFPSQSTPGNYTLFVGPNVQSIYGDSLLQTYAATFGIALPTISGTVTNLAGQPVPGVLMVPDIPNSAVVTDANGNYALGFQPGTPFTLAPMLAGQYAVPASRSYFVGDSLPGQDFLMVDEIAPLLSIGSTGTNLLLSWSGIPGVNYQSLISTNLVQWQTYGAVMVGTNALMELLIPILHGEPQQYFRLTATN